MVDPIKFKIRGSHGVDAPTVDDFADQLRDLISLIQGIERGLSERSGSIEWRITHATTNSPIAIEATPFPKHVGVRIDHRVLAVKEIAAAGLRALQNDAERPSYFDNNVMKHAKRIAERVTNGLSETVIEWGDQEGEFRLTPRAASLLASNASAVLKPRIRPYIERGTIEGFHDGIQPDISGKHVLFIRSRRTGQRIRCVLGPKASEDLGQREIREVLSGRRLQVRGAIHYKTPHEIDYVEVDSVRIIPNAGEIPPLDQIVDRNFTNGLSTEEYLESIRNGRLS